MQNHSGDGRLISHLAKHGGEVRYAYDIEPRSDWVKAFDPMMHLLKVTHSVNILSQTHLGIVKSYIP